MSSATSQFPGLSVSASHHQKPQVTSLGLHRFWGKPAKGSGFLHETQVGGGGDCGDADVHEKSRPELVPEKQDVDADHGCDHGQDVEGRDDRSRHGGPLVFSGQSHEGRARQFAPARLGIDARDLRVSCGMDSLTPRSVLARLLPGVGRNALGVFECALGAWVICPAIGTRRSCSCRTHSEARNHYHAGDGISTKS